MSASERPAASMAGPPAPRPPGSRPGGRSAAAVRELAAPPVCRNCGRVVDSTRRLSIFLDGALVLERDVCSACKVHTLDCAEQAAPWIQSAPVR